MSRPVVLRPEAEADVRETRAELGAVWAGLGDQFAARVREVLEQLERLPELYGVVWQDVRAARLRRMRYIVYYVVFADRVEVLAVLHGARLVGVAVAGLNTEESAMPGGWKTYRCERCPLVIEVGGSVDLEYRDGGFVRVSETAQLACGDCGTLHRVTESGGTCRVSALAGPVRAPFIVTRTDVGGTQFEDEEWFRESDWLPAGDFPGGLADLRRLDCRRCELAGRMLSLHGDRPASGVVGDRCPVCRGPLDGFRVIDSV